MSLVDDAQTLRIGCLASDDQTYVSFTFYAYEAYSRIEEGLALDLLSELPPSVGRRRAMLYVATRSSFLKSIQSGDGEANPHGVLRHYCIVLIEDIINVASSRPPHIEVFS